MGSAAWLVMAWVSACAGMAWLALSLPEHWQQAAPARAAHGGPPAMRLRMLGWAGLALSLVACLLADHATMAVLVWAMLCTLGAASVALTLAYRPGWLTVLGALAGRAPTPK